MTSRLHCKVPECILVELPERIPRQMAGGVHLQILQRFFQTIFQVGISGGFPEEIFGCNPGRDHGWIFEINERILNPHYALGSFLCEN